MAVTSQVDIGARVKFYREKRNLTQAALSKILGFKDRQTLSDIEASKRQISAEELVGIAKAVHVEMDALVDPFRLVGEGNFNFRADNAPAREIDSFEEMAGRWIATYREVRRQAGVRPERFGWKLELTRDSSLEDAEASADALRTKWNLGDIPAEGLERAIEKELRALVLYVDAPRRISGAALHLPGLQTIFVNRNDPPSRRNFDLAHELFHLLTWDAMTPDRVEPLTPRLTKGNRIEMLANKFAAALLVPCDAVTKRWKARADQSLEEWTARTAREFRVSTDALQWRLVGLGLLSRERFAKLKQTNDESPKSLPARFSASFVGAIYDAVESGRLSLRRAATLLNLELGDFAELCRNYGHALSFDS